MGVHVQDLFLAAFPEEGKEDLGHEVRPRHVRGEDGEEIRG